MSLRVEDGEDGVRRITLDRPDAANALSGEMRDGLVEAVRSSRTDGAVRSLLDHRRRAPRSARAWTCGSRR